MARSELVIGKLAVDVHDRKQCAILGVERALAGVGPQCACAGMRA